MRIIRRVSAFIVILVLALSAKQMLAQGGCDGCDGIPTQTTLASSTNTVTYSTPLSLSANVSNGATGTVIFVDNYNATIGQASLANGVASIQIDSLHPGTHIITAQYQGFGGYAPSISSGATVTVTKATASITWAPLSPVFAGATLTTTQLSATSAIAGSFSYSPTMGTTLPVGVVNVSATFTPSDSEDYTTETIYNPLLVESNDVPQQTTLALSQNSGINASDTYVVADITVTSTSTFTDPALAVTTSTQTQVSSTPVAYRLEEGYEVDGTPILNLFPAAGTPMASVMSRISYSHGLVYITDVSGRLLTPLTPQTTNGLTPILGVLNSLNGGSLLSTIVVPDLQQTASALGASLTVNGNQGIIVKQTGLSTITSYVFVNTNQGWQIQNVSSSRATTTGSQITSLGFNNVTAADNPSNDASRIAAGHVMAHHTSSESQATLTLNTQSSPPCGDSCSGTVVTNNYGGTTNVLFQHGFLSSGSTWARMTNWLNEDFQFGNELVTSLAATSPLANQGANLESIISNAGGNNYILIGHSQGGLIARYAAQYFQGTGSGSGTPLVQAVITMDTPHQGAFLTLAGPAAIGNGITKLANNLFDDSGCATPQDAATCAIASLIGVGVTQVVGQLVDSVGALNDLTPGSNFLTQLNSQNETFSQAAILGNTDQPWLVTRVATSVTGIDPDAALGERDIADATEGVYVALNVVEGSYILAEIDWFDYCVFGDGAYDGDPYCDADFSGDIAFYAQIINDMDTINNYYNSLIAAPGDSSDGFVQLSSQAYPSSVALQYPINGADSHQASTRSPYDRSALDYILRTRYNVPAPPPCTYGITTTAVSVDSAGGTFSLPLSTGTGCSWSALSDSPWVTFPAESGVGAANVQFVVASWAGSVPRTATLTVGNGTASAVVYVTQSGTGASVCTYTVSVANAPPCNIFTDGGGSLTVQVTTQTGCAWSGASDSSWINTSATNGIGSGQAQVIVPAVTPPVTQSGNVLVMGTDISIGQDYVRPPSGLCYPGGPHQ